VSSEIVVAMLAVAVSRATPLIFGALSGVLCERSGVVNIGIEGMMLAGAFAGFIVGVYTQSLAWAILAAVAAGAALALLHAVLAIRFRVDQIISGTVINILAIGVTGFFNRQLFATGAPPGQSTFPAIALPVLSDIPFVGRVLFEHKPLTFLAIALVAVGHLALYRSVWGLRLRTVGEHPHAADASGIDVIRTRYQAVLLGGLLAGFGGAYFTLESVPHFEPLMTNGRGFIALAAMIFGKWTPLGALGAALLFGIAEALPVALQIQGINVPFQFVGLLPYVLTIVVLAGLIGRASPPSSVGVPFQR